MNHPPVHGLFHNADMRGGGGDLQEVSKLNVLERSGKKDQIAFDEYSRLALRFLLAPGQHLTQI